MIKDKKASLLIKLGASVVLISGGVAAYWILSQRQLTSRNLPAGANLVPQDALLMLSVSMKPEQWQQFQQFGTPESRTAMERTLTNLRDRFLTPNGYNYQRDIQPWAGKEITFAFLSQPAPPPGKLTQQSSSSPSLKPEPVQQSVVMVLPIDHPLQAKQVLEQPKTSLKQTNWIDRTYKGIEIKEVKQNPAENYSATVLDRRFLVITTDPNTTNKVIDTYLGNPSLANTPGYAQAINKIKTNQPFAKLYVNIPLAAAAAKSGQQSLSPQALAQLQQQQGLASTITLESEGIRFKSISWLKPNSQKKYLVKNEAAMMPKRLPSDTLMMMSGGNLKQFWQDYVQGANSNPITPFKPQDLRNIIKNFTNLDLDRDLINWMGGEFSLSLIPFPESSKEDPPSLSSGVGMVFMVKASDQKAAEKSLDGLDELMKDKYDFKVEKTNIDDRPIVNLFSPSQGLKITHGWLDGNVVFLGLEAPIKNAIIPQPKSTLDQNEKFRNIVPLELNPNNGHFFIDIDRLGIDRTASLLSFLFRLSPDPSTQKILRSQIDPIRAIGVTAAVKDERTSRFDVFVQFKKTQN